MIRKPFRLVGAKERAAVAPLAPVPRVALSLPEAAEALSLCEDTVRAMAKCGKLPSFMQGRRILVRVAALEAYAAAEEAKQMAEIRTAQEAELRRRAWGR